MSVTVQDINIRRVQLSFPVAQDQKKPYAGLFKEFSSKIKEDFPELSEVFGELAKGINKRSSSKAASSSKPSSGKSATKKTATTKTTRKRKTTTSNDDGTRKRKVAVEVDTDEPEVVTDELEDELEDEIEDDDDFIEE